MLHEQLLIAAEAVGFRRRQQRRAALFEFLLGNQNLQGPARHVETNLIARLDQGQRPADRGFRTDMQHDGAEGGAAHAAVRHADHVFHALLGQLLRNRQVAGFRHARRADRSGVAQDQDIVFGDIQVRIIDAVGHVLDGIEDHGPADMALLGSRRLLEDGAARGDVAAQHGDAAVLVDGVVERPDHVLRPGLRRGFELLAEGLAGNGHAVEVEQVLDLAQNDLKPAGLVEVVHVAAARRLDVDEHRGLVAHLVEGVEVDLDAQASRDGGEVDDAVGRSADGHQHAKGVLDGFRGDDLVRSQAFQGHRDGTAAGRFGVAHAVGVDGRDGRAARQHHAQGFGHAGDGAGGAHDTAEADGRNQAAADLGDLLFVDLAGAVLAPETAAVGAGANSLGAMGAAEHRTADHGNGRNAGARRGHQLGRDGLVATTDQDHGVHRLRLDHLFGFHRHHVAQEHAGRIGEGFVQRDGREHDGKAAGQHHAAADRLDQLGSVAVAGIVPASRIGDSDDRKI